MSRRQRMSHFFVVKKHAPAAHPALSSETRSGIRQQLVVFGALLAINAALALLTYLTFPPEQLVAAQPVPSAATAIPRWQLGLANAGLVLVLYGLLGLAGFWFAQKLGLPGVFLAHAGWQHWL